ncbi:MAG: UDP-glucose--hexose-1-phosphate uridylyltransferase [Lachnospiraceae bacterium]|nr:UDP-glucose--hexose-1-phosphate uridylyltransferase [Lachnospiraceae bacterium]
MENGVEISLRNENIAKLVQYGIVTGLIQEEDRVYVTNQILMVMGLDDYEEPMDGLTPPSGTLIGDTGGQSTSENENSHGFDDGNNLEEILSVLISDARNRGGIQEGVVAADLFDSQLMNCLMPFPREVNQKFWSLYENSPKEATDYYYDLSRKSNYIRTARVAKDVKWTVDSAYGEIEMSINCSKPEKDPRAIALAKSMKATAYPKCQLCRENEGYAGRLNHPGRSNHRIIPLQILHKPWGLQYSPYVYYNEHCIVLSMEHHPMVIDRSAFEKLFDFIRQFPHYFVGSNADLPIVGGSILSHEHFQGGCHDFPMAKAPMEKTVTISGYEDVEAGIVKWPLSVIRIRCKDAKRLVDLADHILTTWRSYTDEEAGIHAYTENEPHNTITPIARMRDGKYELDLALRNNRTTEEYPLGIFHPHAMHHNIKKENIGLIEVMGLAILPARLKTEMGEIADAIARGVTWSDKEELKKHVAWFEAFASHYEVLAHGGDCSICEESLKERREKIYQILLVEMGNTFVRVLEDAGVYPCTKEGRMAFDRFLNVL